MIDKERSATLNYAAQKLPKVGKALRFSKLLWVYFDPPSGFN
jgi:hypothetical protein